MPPSPLFRRAACLAALLGPLGAGSARAEPEAPLPFIAIEGTASADLVPDRAEVTVGVLAERPSATAATASLATASQAVRTALGQEGIAAEDIATTGLDLGPVLPEDGKPAATRFRASTTLRITVRKIDTLGALLSRLVGDGANTIENVSFEASNAGARQDELRAEAMRDAKHKAELYAGALGLRLGRVLEIQPSGGEALPPPMPAPMRAMSVKMAPLAVASGTVAVQSRVAVRWALDQ